MLIKPSTAIRQDYTGFSALCHSTEEPIVLTRNGEADLVVMSWESYQRAEARLKLQGRLLEAERQLESGIEPIDSDVVLGRIRRRLDDAGE